METKELVARRFARDVELTEIAVQIRPLDKQVVPSARFREQTRLLLLRLNPGYEPPAIRDAA